MPVTPLHFGPSACIAIPLQKYIDVPVFLLANVCVDFEPLVVLVFNLDYPLHGYCHTFLFATLIGIAWAFGAYPCRNLFRKIMKAFNMRYETGFLKILLSAVLGTWFHVLLDAPLYADIRPFFPCDANPLYGLIEPGVLHLVCILSFAPVFCYLFFIRKRDC